MQGIDIQKIQREKPIEELMKFGVINIDKPAGPTSFSISEYIAKSLKLNKTSHMGTLDPAVTGVLPILLGRACRLSDYFMHKNKTYVGIMRLHEDVSDEKLKEAIKEFIGKIKQLPPLRSRVKREIREREVLSFDVLERKGKDVLFKTEVQAGTYIRTLCVEIGKKIGEAHMLELRRIKAGIFDEESKDYPIIDLYQFDKAVEAYKKGDESLLRGMIVPAEIISQLLPVIQITNKPLIKQLLTGKPLMKRDIDISQIKNIKVEEKITLFSDSTFIGVYKIVSEGDIIARAEFVFN